MSRQKLATLTERFLSTKDDGATRTDESSAQMSALQFLPPICANDNVLTAAAKFYAFLLDAHSSRWSACEAEMERLQVRQERELNDLLTFTPSNSNSSSSSANHSNNNNNSSGGVVVPHEITEAIFARHAEEVAALQRRHDVEMEEAAARAREQFDSFLRTAAHDVVGTLADDEISDRSSPTQNTSASSSSIDFASSAPTKVVRYANPLRPLMTQGARPKDPSLGPIVVEVSPVSSLAQCLALWRGSGSEESVTATRAREHLRRIATNRLGVLVVIGSRAAADELLDTSRRSGNIALLADDTDWSTMPVFPAAVTSQLASSATMKVTTRMWGANIIVNLDPASACNEATRKPDPLSPDLWRCEFNRVLNLCISTSADICSVTFAGSDTSGHPLHRAATLGLVSAIADVQMDFTGIRIPNCAGTALPALLGAPAAAAAGPKPMYNLGAAIRLFVPVPTFNADDFGLGCEVLAPSKT